MKKIILPKDELFDVLAKNLSQKQLLEHFKVSGLTLTKNLLYYGFDKHYLRNKKWNNHNSEKSESCTLYKNIINEEQAYWLGMFWSDGSIVESKKWKCRKLIGLELKEEDCYHVEKFRQFLIKEKIKAGKKIYTSKGRKSCACRFYNPFLANNLIELGIVPNKSNNHDISVDLKKIPEELHVHFWRGVIDGDGCLTYSLDRPIVTLVGNLKTLLNYKDFLKLHGLLGKADIYATKDNLFGVSCSGKNAIKLSSLLYGNSTVSLQRKYEKYLMFNKT